MLREITHAALSVFLLTGVLVAQSEVGSATLNGTVTDPSGASIVNAKVTVTNAATGFTRTTGTTESGLYTFSRLPVGSYDVSVEAQGFKAAKRAALPLSIGAVATLDVRMEVGATQESVTVTAEVGVVETGRSQTSTVVNEKAVADLPINGRNFLDFVTLTPGVVRDPTRGGDLSFGGQRGTLNSVLVDGSDSNNVFFGQSLGRTGTGRNPYSFSQDAVLEFQVAANGYNAEVGRAGGGVVNVITKSGTNDFHGSAFEFFRDKALNANTWANNRNRQPKRAYHFNQFGGNIGGPIVKDRAFFFFDYDGQRNTTPNPVFLTVGPVTTDPLSVQGFNELQRYLTPYTNALDNNVYLGKVDFDLTPTQRLSVRYNANRFKGRNYEFTGTSNAAEHSGNSDVTTDNISANHTAVLGSRAVLESRFVYSRDNEPGSANSDAPEAQIRQGGITVLNIGRNNFSPRYTNIKTYQFVENFSLSRGSHAYKIGFDLNAQRIDNFFPGLFSGSYQFNSYADFAARRPAQFTQGFAGANTDGPLTKPHVTETAFYVQDTWRATQRLTLNYGLRYDLFRFAQPKVKNPDTGLAQMGLDTSRMNQDNNNLGPRFGFAYKLTDSGRIAVRGGWGMYYGRTPSIMVGTAHSQNGIQVQTYTLTSNTPTYPNVLSAPPTAARTINLYVFAPDYVQPLTHQWSFNLELEPVRNTAVTFGYLGVRGIHLSRTRDINLQPAVPVQATISGGGALTYFRHPGRVNPNFARISLFDSGADSIYHGGFIQVTRRYAQSFQLQASYTWSKVIDTVPDFTSVVVGGGDDAKVAQDTLLPNLDRALGNADARHRFVASGIWDINYARSLSNPIARAILSGYQLSPILTLQSGRFTSATIGGNSDLGNDGNTRNDRVPGTARNSLELPGFASLDLRFTRDIPVYKERVRVRLIFEAFNVLNRPNFSSINTTQYNFTSATQVFAPNAAFLTPLDTADPRILQLAAKITF